MTTILLVRHAQTTLNHEQRYQGHLDTDLSPLGLQQARRLAERMASEAIAAIYSSDLRRCMDTAGPSAEALGLVPKSVPALREACYGQWEGRTFASVRDESPTLAAERERDPFAFVPPGGESLGAAHARALAALESIAKRHPQARVLVVTHRGPLRMLVGGLLDIPMANALSLRVDNCGLFVCESFPRSPLFATLNDTCHLRGLT